MVRPVMCSGGFMGKFAFYFNGRGSKRTFTLDFNGGFFVINPMYVPMVNLKLRQCLCNVDYINTCMFIVYSLC